MFAVFNDTEENWELTLFYSFNKCCKKALFGLVKENFKSKIEPLPIPEKINSYREMMTNQQKSKQIFVPRTAFLSQLAREILECYTIVFRDYAQKMERYHKQKTLQLLPLQTKLVN